ncbi:MAG: ribosome silencing factor [bacterium]|nr:ribosome silencing factor [bacterium]
MDDSLELAQRIADICYDKMAVNTLVLDMRELSVMCDYFVIANAPTRVQIADITRAIDDAMSADGCHAQSIQGRHENTWVLLDYGNVIVHLFLSQERAFYNLEGLWSKAPVVYAPDDERERAAQSKSNSIES